jgi:perosamine synthetase
MVAFTMYSFQATKHVTTGDGGVLCVPDKYVERARRLRWFGMDRELPLGPLGEREQDVTDVGGKWHLNDIAATIGIGSLQGFPDRLRRRQAIGRRYREELEGVRGVSLLRMPEDRTHAYYAFGMLVDRRDDFVQTLKEKGIPTSVICRRIDRYSILGGVRDDLPGMDEFDRKQINLPCHSELSDEDVSKVIEAVKGGW